MTKETAVKVIETMMQTMSLCEIEREALRTAVDALKKQKFFVDESGKITPLPVV